MTATDSQAQVVASLYVGWSSTDPAHTIDAQGRRLAGNSRGAFFVIAQLPTA